MLQPLAAILLNRRLVNIYFRNGFHSHSSKSVTSMDIINNYNGYLHELLYSIGEDFLDDVYIDNKINRVITREVKKRYQLISSHSARRSFATINTLRNIPRNSILRATGHASEESFVRYICYNDE